MDVVDDCATADCQVLGAGPPTVELVDSKHPDSGGIKMSFLAIPPEYVPLPQPRASVAYRVHSRGVPAGL